MIDLECLDWGNPFLECWEQALTWAGYTELSFDPDRFAAFLSGYRFSGGDFPTVGAGGAVGAGKEEYAVLFDSSNARLDWLAYNLDRALGRVSCTADESAVGEAEAKATIAQAVYYESLRGAV